jgi:hypothetical protein
MKLASVISDPEVPLLPALPFSSLSKPAFWRALESLIHKEPPRKVEV